MIEFGSNFKLDNADKSPRVEGKEPPSEFPPMSKLVRADSPPIWLGREPVTLMEGITIPVTAPLVHVTPDHPQTDPTGTLLTQFHGPEDAVVAAMFVAATIAHISESCAGTKVKHQYYSMIQKV